MPDEMKQYVTIDCFVEHETTAALLVQVGDDQHWLPKSQIKCRELDEGQPVKGITTSIEVPEWLAVEKGLV